MNHPSLAIIDYGASNLGSVAKALETLGYSPIISSDPKIISKAHTLILPGQGRCDRGMKCLDDLGLSYVIRNSIEKGKPFLGVCVGLQILFQLSEEGNTSCLGVFPGKVLKFPESEKVPHMGWNQVHLSTKHQALQDIPQDSHFYFVHSYYVEPEDKGLTAGNTTYGVNFCSVLAKDNIVATQFHPEKSSKVGLAFYEKFLNFAFGME